MWPVLQVVFEWCLIFDASRSEGWWGLGSVVSTKYSSGHSTGLCILMRVVYSITVIQYGVLIDDVCTFDVDHAIHPVDGGMV